MRKLLLFIISLVIFNSCTKSVNQDFERFRIASEKTYMPLADGEWGEGYIVAYRDNYNIWSYFPHDIKGFDYAPGTEYLIHLNVKDVKDSEGNKIKEYSLRKIVWSILSISQDLPTSELGTMMIGSELRIDPANKEVNSYPVKFLDDNGEWSEWKFVEESHMLHDEFLTGFEYKVEYMCSNVSGKNETVDVDSEKPAASEFYRIVEVTSAEEKESEGLPGNPVPSGDK